MPASFEIVNAQHGDLGYVGHICRAKRFWAVGGTHGKPTVLVSDDGRKFDRMPAPKVNGLRDLLPLGERLVVCGESGGVFVSDDGAATWSERSLDTKVCLFTLSLDSRGHLWVAGERGFVRRSKDRGETWSAMAIGTDARVNVIAPIDGAVLFACHDGTLFRYRRERIERLKVKASAPFTSFERTKKGTLVLVGDRGTIARSEDGKTFALVDSPTNVDLEHVREIDPGILVACGDKSTIAISRDEGKSFELEPCTLPGHLWTLCPTENGALIGGESGLIAKMELGGVL
jgi:photosystem II stability/assembly factor-like uncharacterized protein